MRRILRIAAIVWLAAAGASLPGCNGSAFIESFEPEAYYYALEGDGSQCAINFASADWKYLWVKVAGAIADDEDAQPYYFDVRDARGNVLTQGHSLSARLDGRGYIHVTAPGLSVYFMRDKGDRVLVHCETAPLRPVSFDLSARSPAGPEQEVTLAVSR